MAHSSARKPQDLVTLELKLLVAQFLLGMALNLIPNPTNTFELWSEHIILLLHVVLALTLILNAINIYRKARGSSAKPLAHGGMAAVGAAFLFGVLTLAAPLANLWSFGMAAAFITAFIVYGKLYLKAKSSLKD